MAKLIGLSRNLKLVWLNKVVELVLEGLEEKDIKAELNDYLSYEISSPTNVRKTREILMNIWVYENEQTKKIRDQALCLIKAYPDYDIAIHWCMLLATYPVFCDMCKLIGKLSEFQDEITLAQVKQKLFDEWGERVSLFHSIDKLIATMKALAVLVPDKPGKYHITYHKIANPQVTALMVYTMMIVDDSGYYMFSSINSSVYLFPFTYRLEKETLLTDNRFSIGNFGGELSISLND